MKTQRPLAAFGLTLFAAALVSVVRFESEPRHADPTAEQVEAAVSYAHAAAGLEDDRPQISH